MLASLTCAVLQPAARALAQAAGPFPEVLVPAPERRPYTWAVVSFTAGAALIGASFGFVDAADRRYSEYLRETDPARIADLYDEALVLDRMSSASILCGEVLIATGVYLAFLRRSEPAPAAATPGNPRVSWTIEPTRCGVALRF